MIGLATRAKVIEYLCRSVTVGQGYNLRWWRSRMHTLTEELRRRGELPTPHSEGVLVFAPAWLWPGRGCYVHWTEVLDLDEFAFKQHVNGYTEYRF